MKIFGAVIATFLLIGTGTAFAGEPAACPSTDDAGTIAACTKLIGSRTVTGHNLALAYLYRGRALSRGGNPQPAVADFRQAVTADPAFADGYNDLGLALLELKNDDGAIVAFDRAIALKPRLALAFANRGVARHNKNQDSQAIIDFSRAIGIDPKLSDAYRSRGISYAFLRDYDRAILDYTAALKAQPDDVLVLNNRADAWRNKRVFAKALDDLDHALRVQPDFAEAYYTRGETYKDMGDRDRALAELHKAIGLDKAGTYHAFGEKLIAQLGDAVTPTVQTADNDSPVAPTLIGPSTITEKRVALVIANSSYKAVGLLPNPTRDGELVAAAFRQDGFNDVVVVKDAGRAAMVDALKAFAKSADAADWAVIYYAGHGIEMAGENYLIPVDATLATDRDVPDEAIALDRVLTTVEGAHKLRLVVLDACRNNPFAAKMQVTSASRAIGRGLSRVEPAQATLVAYAAKDGSVAADGDTGNSPFAASFAKRVVEAGVEINKVFRLVRSDVMAATGNQQEPFVYGSLPPDDFYFVPPKA